MRKTRAKVIVVGDHAVGKTSLVHNFVHEGQNFNREYKMTTGIDIQSKIVTIESVRKDIELFFFDCSGHPMYRSLVAESIKDANYCVVCFSMTSEESFKSVTNWHEIIKKSNGGKDVKGVLVGTKSEISKKAVKTADGHNLAKKLGLDYFETSSYSLENVEAPFQAIVKLIHPH